MSKSKTEPLLVKYRTWTKAVPPQKIKLDVPGWSGENWYRGDGAKPMPWHCTPFVDGSTYGLELIYNFDSECHVKNINGKVTFEGDFAGESEWIQKKQQPEEDPNTPFMMFAPGHYGHTSGVDLLPPEGHCLRIEPHPRFFTDTSGTVPIAVPGHIQRFWPKIFFIAFKAPLPGQTHIFRKGEAMCSVLIVPEVARYDLQEMSPEEKANRQEIDTGIATHAGDICKHSWKDHVGNTFDDKYKVLKQCHSKGGLDAVEEKVKGCKLSRLYVSGCQQQVNWLVVSRTHEQKRFTDQCRPHDHMYI